MKKKALSLLIILTMVVCLFSGLTVTASAAAALADGTIVVNVIIQNNSNYASPAWSGYLFNGTTKSISASADTVLDSGDIYSVDYTTGTVGIVVPSGSSVWTAVKDVLDAGSVSYDHSSGMLNAVNGMASDYSSGYNYWSFYHKVGSAYYYANLGLGSYIVSSGETICVAYQSADGVDGVTGASAAGTSTSVTGFSFGSDGSSFAYDSTAGMYKLTTLADATSFKVSATPHSASKTVKIYSTYLSSYDNKYYMSSYLTGLNTAISFSDGDVFCIVEGSEEYEYYVAVNMTSASDLAFYFSGGYDYSMLGNNWTNASPLTCAAGETPSNLRYGYDSVSSTVFRYLSACTNVTLSDMSKLNVTVYYSGTYSATGSGYTSVSIPTSGASGTVDNISYYNSYVNTYGNYYNFMFYPDTTTPGTYYYYVVIKDTVNDKTITSVGSQAVVKVGRLYAWASTSGGVMTAKYVTAATNGLDSGNYYLKYQAKNSTGLGLYFFTAAYARDSIPASGSVELSGASKIEISLVKASDGSVVDTLTVS
ncbi:MAG: hypothetical protein CVU91_11870 [Firmicutes bacterium HGW-Firmicutes-16]|nr:MAG: hypothetical protein CVU91_11870 [Firmicutes bacterium HGW-Firmicutes-16]